MKHHHHIIISAENLKTKCWIDSYFGGNRDYTRGHLSKKKQKKQQHLFEIETYCNILHDYTVTFDQFNVPLFNKGILFPLQISYWA